MTRPTQAQIILPALRHNLSLIRSKIQDADNPAEIIAVVKADAYGHGSVEVSSELVKQGIKWLAVISLEEAMELHGAGMPINNRDVRIIILGPLREDEAAEVVGNGFIPVLSSLDDLNLLESAAKNISSATCSVILDFDTGMGRMGFLPEQLAQVSDRVGSVPGIEVAGIFSHLAVADGNKKLDREYTSKQINEFKAIVKGMQKKRPPLELVSIANSGGIFYHPDSIMNAVRPGITLYGVKPGRDLDEPHDLEPVMRWVTEIARVRSLPAGASISYGRKTVLERRSRIALLPVGYADGLKSRLPPGFNFMVKGKPAPIAGVVTMDFTMIDVTDVPEAGPGDRVLIMGKEGRDSRIEVRAEDHARAAGTIPYEILTGVGPRVKRAYLEDWE